MEGWRKTPGAKKVGDNIAGKTICAFGEACSWPTQSFVQKFREEFPKRAPANLCHRRCHLNTRPRN